MRTAARSGPGAGVRRLRQRASREQLAGRLNHRTTWLSRSKRGRRPCVLTGQGVGARGAMPRWSEGLLSTPAKRRRLWPARGGGAPQQVGNDPFCPPRGGLGVAEEIGE